RHLEVAGGRLLLELLDGTTPRRLGATGIELRGGLLLEGRRREVHLASLRLTPRGIALSPVEGAVQVVAADTLKVSELRLVTARSALEATGRVTPGREVTARVSLALDPGEVRAIVPTSRLTDGVRATLDAAGPWPAVTVAAATAFDAGGAAKFTASLDLAARPARYSVGARFWDLDPGATVDGLVRARVSGRGRLRGRGVGFTVPLAYHLALGPSEVAGRALAAASVHGRSGSHVHHARARVVTSAGAVEVRAGAAAGASVAYRLASRLDCRKLEDLVPAVPGSLTARVTVVGRGTGATDRRARLRATVSRAVLLGVPLTGGVVEMQLDGEALRLVGASVDGPELHATASGTADLGRRTIDLGVDGTADRLALAGARSATRTTVELRELVWTPPEGPAWRLAGPAAVVVADEVTTPGVTLVAGAQRVAIAGRVALRGSSDATVTVTRLALGPLCALEKGPRCGGELTAHAALTGTAEHPALQASLRTENF